MEFCILILGIVSSECMDINEFLRNSDTSAIEISQSSFDILSKSLPSCQFEDSSNCAWDSSTSGNQKGSSFIDIDGIAIYTKQTD